MLLSRSDDISKLEDAFFIAAENIQTLGDEHIRANWLKLESLYETLNVNAYHNTTHILDCIQKFEQLAWGELEDKINLDLFTLAFLFHDCIYIPGDKDNEYNSREFLWKIMTDLKFSASNKKYATNLIIMKDKDMLFEYNIFRDIDYSILGEHRHTYEEYVRSIENEYLSVYDYKDYVLGRLTFLKSLLNSKRLYHSGMLGSLFEPRAFQNMKKEMWKLEAEKERLWGEEKSK